MTNGRIDLHSHLLPGIDDGCQNLGESLACVRLFIEHGYAGTVCTPHFIPTLFPDNIPAKVAPAVDALQAEINAAGLEYQLWPGGEVRIDRATIEWFESYGVPTLGPSRYVLVDWWGVDWPPYATGIFEYLQERDFKPILAHPERMGLKHTLLRRVLDDLKRRGVLLQGNFNSASGGEGPDATALFFEFLKADRYDLFASDMHRPNTLEGRFRGLEGLELGLGPERLGSVLVDWPRTEFAVA